MYPGHELARVDLQTATRSMQTFDRLLDIAQTVAYEAINRVIKDLYNKAVSLMGAEHIDEPLGLDAWDPTADMEHQMGLYGDDRDFTDFVGTDHQTSSGLEFDSLLTPFTMEEFLPN